MVVLLRRYPPSLAGYIVSGPCMCRSFQTINSMNPWALTRSSKPTIQHRWGIICSLWSVADHGLPWAPYTMVFLYIFIGYKVLQPVFCWLTTYLFWGPLGASDQSLTVCQAAGVLFTCPQIWLGAQWPLLDARSPLSVKKPWVQIGSLWPCRGTSDESQGVNLPPSSATSVLEIKGSSMPRELCTKLRHAVAVICLPSLTTNIIGYPLIWCYPV